MTDVDYYLQAGTRNNTRKSYRSAINHFEVEWGGFLPATSDMVARYLANYAKTLSSNTLKLRLAALAQWHIEQGMPDPTKAPVVKKVMRGIKASHPVRERQAKPLQLEQLRRASDWLDKEIAGTSHKAMQLKYTRNRAILLLGFWKGFRSDELSRLAVELITLDEHKGLELFLPYSKGDREYRGETYRVPALLSLCPVQAVSKWLEVSELTSGPLFRRIDRWGHLSEEGLHPGSFISLLKSILAAAGVDAADEYSSHSLRRGFASWATANEWDIKSLMKHVGWKDVRTAMRYLPTASPFQSMSHNPL